ncbi:MAG: hypothetical protein AB2813_15925, partial [Candidatus Sedimenticola endophacoides]
MSPAPIGSARAPPIFASGPLCVGTPPTPHLAWKLHGIGRTTLKGSADESFRHPSRQRQVCRYLVKDFGTSQSPKSTRQRDSRYCP